MLPVADERVEILPFPKSSAAIERQIRRAGACAFPKIEQFRERRRRILRTAIPEPDWILGRANEDWQRARHDPLHLELWSDLWHSPFDTHCIDDSKMHSRFGVRSCCLTCTCPILLRELRERPFMSEGETGGDGCPHQRRLKYFCQVSEGGGFAHRRKEASWSASPNVFSRLEYLPA